jgi:hypothetical protein
MTELYTYALRANTEEGQCGRDGAHRIVWKLSQNTDSIPAIVDILEWY